MKKHNSILSFLLIVFLFASLLNVQVARADGETPTEPPVATEVVTEPAVESTPEPVEATPVPEEPLATEAAGEASPEATPVAGLLSAVPQDTNIVVVDENGETLALGSQETADAVVKSDPVWCPAGINVPTPGANGCSVSYGTITELLTAMRTNPAAFNQAGTIFLEVLSAPGFTTPLILDNSASSLGAAFATLSLNNLLIRGGWNPGTNTVTGAQALFGVSGSNEGYIRVGSQANPWVGNVTLRDIEVRGISAASSVVVYTSSGNITLDDVDVAEQTGDQHLAYLHSLTGNIHVGNGSNFDGDDTGSDQSTGFFAQTGGSITIDGTDNPQYTFRDNEGVGADTHNGAELTAPSVTLINVISRANDGNGIVIMGASNITLQNVTSSVNQANGTGNGLSGVLVYDSPTTVVNVYGGTFAKNGLWGIQLFNGTGQLVVHSAPNCPTANNTRNGSGCYNVTPVSATPTQPTPTQPTPTEPTPTQPTPTEPSPTQPTPTEATPTPPTTVPTQSTQVPLTVAPSTPGAPTSISSGSGSGSQGVVLPVTGGPVELDCNSVFWVAGIKVSFMNLCDQQASIETLRSGDLPGQLPDGFSFVTGLDLSVLAGGAELETLPEGAGIQVDFPAGTEEYAVLYWDESKGAWTEVSQELNADGVAQALNESEGDGLYQLIDNVVDAFLKVLTTDHTGIFVLVKK